MILTIFNNIADLMGTILAFVYKVIPNYGLAIIGLTVIVRLVLFPLTAMDHPADLFTNTHEAGSAGTAQTIQMRLVLKF